MLLAAAAGAAAGEASEPPSATKTRSSKETRNERNERENFWMRAGAKHRVSPCDPVRGGAAASPRPGTPRRPSGLSDADWLLHLSAMRILAISQPNDAAEAPLPTGGPSADAARPADAQPPPSQQLPPPPPPPPQRPPIVPRLSVGKEHGGPTKELSPSETSHYAPPPADAAAAVGAPVAAAEAAAETDAASGSSASPGGAAGGPAFSDDMERLLHASTQRILAMNLESAQRERQREGAAAAQAATPRTGDADRLLRHRLGALLRSPRSHGALHSPRAPSVPSPLPPQALIHRPQPQQRTQPRPCASDGRELAARRAPPAASSEGARGGGGGGGGEAAPLGEGRIDGYDYGLCPGSKRGGARGGARGGRAGGASDGRRGGGHGETRGGPSPRAAPAAAPGAPAAAAAFAVAPGAVPGPPLDRSPLARSNSVGELGARGGRYCSQPRAQVRGGTPPGALSPPGSSAASAPHACANARAVQQLRANLEPARHAW